MISHILVENLSFLRALKVLKFEFAVEAIIVFVKNIKKALSAIFTLLAIQSYELSQFLENLSLLRAQKVLKFEFTVEVIIIFIKNT